MDVHLHKQEHNYNNNNNNNRCALIFSNYYITLVSIKSLQVFSIRMLIL